MNRDFFTAVTETPPDTADPQDVQMPLRAGLGTLGSAEVGFVGGSPDNLPEIRVDFPEAILQILSKSK